MIVKFPTVIFEVGFTAGATTSNYLHLDDTARGILDTNTLAPDSVLVDVGADLMSLTTTRGSNRVEDPVVRYEAGTCTAVLRDLERDYDPNNLAGPYVAAGVTQVTPMRVIQIRATYNSTTYGVWRGFADSWIHTYGKPNYAAATVTATDGFKVLAAKERAAVAGVGAGEDSGARVGRILNSANWSTSDRMISTGDTTLQATILADNVLAELQLVADTEIGELYMDEAGRVFFRNRQAVVEDTRSNTSQATFGDGGGSELPYEDITPSYDDDQLFNEIRISRAGGSEQTSSDSTSIQQYLTHTHERSDLLMQTDPAAADYAGYVLHQSKDPEYRFEQLVINPRRDPDNLFPQVLTRRIGDRITVKRRPPGGGSVISRDVLIRGIQHEVDFQAPSWRTRWTLQSATRLSFLILDNATLGQLDNNALGF